MALIHCSFGSDALGMTTDINVIMPDLTEKGIKEETVFPTLYLLHGASDNYSNWLRFTSLERYAQEHGIAVVMPEAGLSFYNDMPIGYAYYTYITKELPAFARAMFPLSEQREKNFLAGLSMGGYGTARIVLNNPELFSAAGIFSGAVNITEMVNTDVGFMDVAATENMMKRAFGIKNVEKLKGTDADPVYLLETYRECPEKMPRLYVSCGLSDFLYEQNQVFCRKAKVLGLPVHYEEWAGDHNWLFWDESIRKFLTWIEQREEG